MFPNDVTHVMSEMRRLVAIPDPSREDVAQLLELDASLELLLDACAARCRELADHLARREEHALDPSPGNGFCSAGAVALAQKLEAAWW